MLVYPSLASALSVVFILSRWVKGEKAAVAGGGVSLEHFRGCQCQHVGGPGRVRRVDHDGFIAIFARG